jgi:hypothetical protein
MKIQTRGSTDVGVELHVNGRARRLPLDSSVTLLDARSVKDQPKQL